MLLLHFRFLRKISSLLLLKLWHTYAYSHPNRGLKCTQMLIKNGCILRKNVVLKINYQNEGHLDVNFLIYMVTIYGEYLLFQFFSRGIRTAHCHPNRSSKWTHKSPKNSHILQRNVLSQAYFRSEGHLHANSLFYILSLYLTCLLFQNLTRGILMHMSIRTGVLKRHIGAKNGYVLLKKYF